MFPRPQPAQSTPARGHAVYSPRAPIVRDRFGYQTTDDLRLDDLSEVTPEAVNVVDLADGDVGILEHGRRYLVSGERAHAIDPGPQQLNGVLAIPASLGGGFIFWLLSSQKVYFAATFDGPLLALANANAFELGPHCIFLQGDPRGPHLFELPNGKVIAGAPPGIEELRGHPDGFAIALGSGPTPYAPKVAYFSADGRAWKRLAIPDPGHLSTVGAALSIVADSTTYKPGRKSQPLEMRYLINALGIVRKVSKQEAEEISTPEPFELPPRPGALLAHGLLPLGRGEWLTLRGTRLYIKRDGIVQQLGGELGQGLGGKIGRGLHCNLLPVGEAMWASCASLGKHQLYRLDLEKGNHSVASMLPNSATPVPTSAMWVTSTSGSYTYPLALHTPCGSRTLCVYDGHGAWPALGEAGHGRELIFSGERVSIEENADGSRVLRSTSLSTPLIANTETMKQLGGAGDSPNRYGVPPGVLRTDTGFKFFYREFAPAQGALTPKGYALELPVDGGAPRVHAVNGVVLTAGRRALRFDAQKVYETADGWVTWQEVAPPQTGIPDALDGATCDDRGCLLGAWARVGWDLP
jgi:hypothetical protein